MTDQKHPDQPLYKDENGTLRFKQNAIIRYLMDAGLIDFNQLAIMPFSLEDRRQFFQLIVTHGVVFRNWAWKHLRNIIRWFLNGRKNK